MSTDTSSIPARKTGAGCCGAGVCAEGCAATSSTTAALVRSARMPRNIQPSASAPALGTWHRAPVQFSNMSVRDVLIIGAGPSGLATAIAAKHFGLDYVVLEQGSLVDGIARFPINMVFFTTPELLEIGGLPLTSPYDKPTRAEALQYYRKVVDTFQLNLSLHEQVLSIERPESPGGPFAVET